MVVRERVGARFSENGASLAVVGVSGQGDVRYLAHPASRSNELPGKAPEATLLYERRREWLEFEALSPEEQEAVLNHTFEFTCSSPSYGWEEIEVTVDGKRGGCRASYVGTTVDEFSAEVRAMGELDELRTDFALEPGGYSWYVSRRFDLVYLNLELRDDPPMCLCLRWQTLLDAIDPDELEGRVLWEQWWRNDWLGKCWEDDNMVFGYLWSEGLWNIDLDDDELNRWDGPDSHWWSHRPNLTPDNRHLLGHIELLRIPWTTDELSASCEILQDLEEGEDSQDGVWLAEDRGYGWEQLLVDIDGQHFEYSDYGMDELVATVNALGECEDVIFRHEQRPGPHDWFFSRRGCFVQVGMASLTGQCFLVTYDHLRAAFNEALVHSG